MVCQATSVWVDNGVGAVASVVDTKTRDVAVHVAVSLLVSNSGVQTDGQVEVVATLKPSYASMATQATLVPTEPRNGPSGGPVPPAEGAGPQSVRAQAFIVHGVPTRMSLDEIFWYADRLRIGVGEHVIRARWLVGLDRRRGKTASALALYFSCVVPVRGRVLKCGGRWCPVDCYECARRSVTGVCTCCGRW